MDIYPNIFKVEKVKSRYQRWIKAIWNSRLVRHKHNSWFSITWKSSLRVCDKTLCVLCAPAFCVSCVLCVCVLCPVFVRRALLGSLQEGSVCVLCSHILCVLCVLCLAFCVFVRRALIGGFLQGSVCVFCSRILCVLRSHILCVLCVLCLALSLQELLLEGLCKKALCVSYAPRFCVFYVLCMCVSALCPLYVCVSCVLCVFPVSCVLLEDLCKKALCVSCAPVSWKALHSLWKSNACQRRAFTTDSLTKTLNQKQPMMPPEGFYNLKTLNLRGEKTTYDMQIFDILTVFGIITEINLNLGIQTYVNNGNLHCNGDHLWSDL